MALILNYNKMVYGKLLSFENSYVKVVNVLTTKEYAVAQVSIYPDSQIRDELNQVYYEFTPDLTEGSANSLKQAYLYIKTLPDFDGATDA